MFEVDSAAVETDEDRDEAIDLGVDPLLLRAVVRGTKIGLKMTQCEVVPIGTSRLTTARHSITVMVGLVGNHSGNIALNLSEAGALHLASGLLGTPVVEIDEDCVDAVMELGNMLAGGIKSTLSSTLYAISSISLPSLVLGQTYTMGYARGIRAVSVEFEISQMSFATMNARYFSTTLSLLRGSGA